MKKIKKILWDYNGTLLNDASETYAIILRIVVDLGGSSFTFEEFREMFTSEYMDFYHQVGIKHSREALKHIFLPYVREITPRLRLFDDVSDPIRLLSNLGIEQDIISMSVEEMIVPKILEHGLHNIFHGYHCGLTLEDKLSKALSVAESDGLLPESIVVVDDTDMFLARAKKAGFSTVGHSRGYVSRGRLEKAEPDIVVDDYGSKFTKFILSL